MHMLVSKNHVSISETAFKTTLLFLGVGVMERRRNDGITTHLYVGRLVYPCPGACDQYGLTIPRRGMPVGLAHQRIRVLLLARHAVGVRSPTLRSFSLSGTC